MRRLEKQCQFLHISVCRSRIVLFEITQHFYIEYDLSKIQINATPFYIIYAVSRIGPYLKIQVSDESCP